MKQPIYLDYNATTSVDECVLTRMLPYFSERFANAASRDCAFGRAAAEAVNEARDHVAALISAEAQEIIFTSGATESVNYALRRVAGLKKPCRLITCLTEHEAVLETCRALEISGSIRIDYLPVDGWGRIQGRALETCLKLEAAALALMIGKIKIGSINLMKEVASIVRARNISGSLSTFTPRASIWLLFAPTRFMAQRESVLCSFGAADRNGGPKDRYA